MITLEQIKKDVNNKLNVDISSNSRKRNNVYAKRIYCKIARDLGYVFSNISGNINMNHATMIYHYNHFQLYDNVYKIVYNELCLKYGLTNNLVDVKIKDVSDYKINFLKSFQEIVLSWSENDVKIFNETKLKPFVALKNN